LAVDDVAWETIDERSVNHLRVRLDTKAYLKGTDAPTDALPEEMDCDVWLDEFHRLRRLSFDVDGVYSLADYTEWGAIAPIEAPRPRELVETPHEFGEGSTDA
jgi:hypothetical protein